MSGRTMGQVYLHQIAPHKRGNRFHSTKVELGAVTTMRGLLGVAAGDGVRGDW